MKGVAWTVALLIGFILFVPCLACADVAPSESSRTAEAGPLSTSLASPTSPLASEQLQAEREAQLASPQAVAEREASRTKFSNLGPEQAVKTDAESFPALISERAGGPPKLPAGQSIAGYLSDYAASVDLADGQQALVESMAPMAIETPGGGHMPVDLDLAEAGGAFEPKTPLVDIRIPKRLGDGVNLSDTEVSLTPVDAQGDVLGGAEGVLDGAGVVYANVQTDTDEVVKPTTGGFAADTLLRSAASPLQLYFCIGLPAGASLSQVGGSGPVEVVDEGTMIATILPPSAQDAAGTSVPVSMSLSGDMLALTVEVSSSAEYRWPIEVDPEVRGEDSQLTTGGGKRTNWEFYTNNGKKESSGNFASAESGGILKTYGVHEYKEGEAASWVYQTRGVSKIYEFEGETEASNKEDRIESIIELQHEGGVTEEKELLSNETKGPVEYAKRPLPEPLCPKGKESCVSTSGNKENSVHFQQSVVNKPTSKYSFSDAIDSGTVYISEPEKTHSTTSENTTSPEFEFEVENSKHEKEKQKRKNVLDGAGNWLTEYEGATQFIAKDPGIGVAKSWLEYENSGKWEALPGSEHNYLEEGLCKGIQCESEQKEYWTLNKHLPNGEDKIRYRAEEAFGDATHETESLASEGVGTVKVDYSKPRNIFVSGLPWGNELAEKSYELTVYATDGEGSTIASSGIKSIELYVEIKGKSTALKEVGKEEGKCIVPKGECTASAKFDINGSELGAGYNKILMVATDNAGNEAREQESISIRHSTPVPLGPGSVDLESGDFALGPTDVSLGGGLSVSRVYSSRDVTAGVEGGSLLGSQWNLSTGSEESLVEMVDGSVLVTSGNGSQTVFAAVYNSEKKPTGKFEPPPGDSNLTVTLEENEKHEKVAYYLKDAAAGTSTKFVLSSTAKVWVPAMQEGLVSADTVNYFYETVEVGGKKITRPSEERGATPAKVSCAPKMEPGCRALKFMYATKTKGEIGEGPTEWGEYEGRLVKIAYEGYNPATKKMTETPIPVAEYAYDRQGRLRAEWDPRVSPALKTTYGYDAEGHVTALIPPGEEPWAFTYGTVSGDAGSGRLIKVTRAPTSAGLWKGEAVTNSEVPKITGTPAFGNRMSVSNGAWSGSPVVYEYQWEDCNASTGGECTPIPGANSQNYTPVRSDTGSFLGVEVNATNGGGTTTVASSRTTVRVWGTPVPVFSLKYGKYGTENGDFNDPQGIAIAENGDIWVADTGNSRLQEFSELEGKITFLRQFGHKAGLAEGCGEPTQLDDPDALAVSKGEVWVAENEPSDCIKEFNEEGKKVAEVSTGAEFEQHGRMEGIAIDASGNLWYTEYQSDADKVKVIEYNPSTKKQVQSWGTYGSGPGQFEAIHGITVEHEHVFVTSEKGIQEFTEKGKEIVKFGEGAYYSWERAGSSTLVSDSEGNVWSAGYEAGAKGYNEKGEFLTAFPESHPSPNAVTIDSKGNFWILEGEEGPGGLDDFEKYTPGAKPVEGELHAQQPGWTVDYEVPVSGTSAPHNMSATEVAKWGQSAEEAPTEATAITPPDSPQGWPASSYARATIYYLDQNGRVVNTATPSIGSYGAIATTEYNQTNDVVRTLSPDNRAAALKEGCEPEPPNCASAKTAKLLSTEDTYNGEGEKESEVSEPGTQLILSRGPEHMVKYTAGEEHYEAGEKPKEAMARSLTKYFYNEGAPAENPRTKKKEIYDLLTTTQNYAQLINGEGKETETQDISEAKTSYSGQNDLGWQLRAPTSSTTNPGSLNLTSTTEYYENEASEAFGQVKETRGAGAEGVFTYTSKFGEVGSEDGKLKSPFGVAIDSKGDIWIADEGNSRIEEFGSSGEYLSVFGKSGKETGQLKAPKGIAIDAKGDIWVAEAGNDRVQEFSPEGKSLQTFGKEGSEAGELNEPKALAIDASGNVWVADSGNNRIEEFSSEGKYVSSFGKIGSEAGELKEPKGIAIDAKGDIWVADSGNDRVEEFSPEGKLLSHFGELGKGAGQFTGPIGLAFDGSGHLWVVDGSNNRVQEFSSTGAFITQFGWKGSEGGQLDEPKAIAFNAQGEIWASDTVNNRLEKFAKGPNAHDAKTIYYTLETDTEYPGCGKHAEWAGLVCETLPAKQPELAGLPKLPATTTTYNIWGEPETIEETFGSGAEAKKRTTKDEYDTAGRLKTSEETSTATTETTDRALPAVTDEYNSTIGVLEKQSTKTGETTKTITSKYNTLGQLEDYTDADGNVAKFKYGGPEKDGLLEEVSDSSDDGETNQKYTYEGTTKQVSTLVDSAAGTVTASYDTEGRLVSEIYPNGMCANYTYNSVGEATRVQYVKTTNCSEKEPAVWYSDERMSSIRGEMMSQTSTLASESYAYDQAGRLTEAQETPAGEGCTTRLYAYDESSNRTSLTTRKPGGEGKCATEGGTVEAHDYDEADRLADNGIAYDPLGNITKLPSGDAEGHALESTFYVDNAVATQTQNGVTNDYYPDPEGRIRETIAGAKKTITHYDGPGEAVAWTCEGAEKASACESTAKWTRNIPGIDGALTATQNGTGTTGETPILQLHDLQGNVVATIKDKAGETKLESTYNSTEFGAPNGGKEPPKFAWLGAAGVEKSLASGVITEGATSYVPQTGRTLQSEEVVPPGLPDGSGGAAATFHGAAWNLEGIGRVGAEAPGKEAGREREAAEAACRADLESCSEDPAWSGDVSISAAEAISGALEGLEIVYYVGGGEVAKKVLDILAEHVGINYLSQLKEIVEHAVFGYSADEVAKWAFSMGNLLNTCAEAARSGEDHPREPHCWLYLPTVVRHLYKGGPRLGEMPNFSATPIVGYCPWGKNSACYEVNDW